MTEALSSNLDQCRSPIKNETQNYIPVVRRRRTQCHEINSNSIENSKIRKRGYVLQAKYISAYLVGLFVVLAVARFASGIIITQHHVYTDSLRFFAIGDWGGQSFSPYYTNVEKAVANEMGKLGYSREPQFILALGRAYNR